VTEDGAVICVTGGCCGSLAGTNSVTVPVTSTNADTDATPGGGPTVKTKMPSDVAGSASTVASGSWMKNPSAFMLVTTPRVVTTAPTIGDVLPGPWMS
jgi:hypothetical protein